MTTQTQVGERPVRYDARSITTQPPEQVEGWTVKRYTVSALRERPPAPVEDFARLAVRRSLPAPHAAVPAHALSVLHEDEDGVYVVVGWWSLNGLILHSRTWLANWSDLTTLIPAPGNATACVWELLALGHARDRWVEHVLRPEEPDFARYLAAELSGRF
ncbi:hypothetical protein, partial [Kitasatospora nipponensis]|uniref:hypothetical protein n=1 Tax=Kitasatospora nipponensis TaxID=258049 RepID=UPI0031D0FC48